MRIYITSLGDEWDFIAKKQLGSEKYAARLMEANEQYRNTLVFPAGLELAIPDIGASIPSILPPWKKVT